MQAARAERRSPRAAGADDLVRGALLPGLPARGVQPVPDPVKVRAGRRPRADRAEDRVPVAGAGVRRLLENRPGIFIMGPHYRLRQHRDPAAVRGTSAIPAINPDAICDTSATSATNPDAICDACAAPRVDPDAIRCTSATPAINPDAIGYTSATPAPNPDAILLHFCGPGNRF